MILGRCSYLMYIQSFYIDDCGIIQSSISDWHTERGLHYKPKIPGTDVGQSPNQMMAFEFLDPLHAFLFELVWSK